jgi:hypothetical protein
MLGMTQLALGNALKWYPQRGTPPGVAPCPYSGPRRNLRLADPGALSRNAELDDDSDEITHFLHQAGFLHLRVVYTGFRQPLMEGDLVEQVSVEKQRAARPR